MTDVLDSIIRSRNERDRKIVRTSIIGIIVNILLAVFKGTIGVITNSVAVTTDAVNNLTDALSSVITIIGTKLAGKKPDKKHPLGYGRVEYLTAMIISGIVLYAGITAATESFDRILNPEDVSYSTVVIVILGVAVVVKIFLGRYFRSVGKSVNSDPLIASGTDALLDAILSFSVFVSAIIFVVWGVAIEAYVGIVIGLMIVRTAIEMIWETLNDLLGRRSDKTLSDDIKCTICEHENVNGAYDLMLHSYGPEKIIGSVHIEVPDTMTMDEFDCLSRDISKDVYTKHNIIMAAIGVYTYDAKDELAKHIRSDITEIAMSHEGVLQLHGFQIDREQKTITFDMIIDYSISDREKLYDHLCEEICTKYPDYKVQITLDVDL